MTRQPDQETSVVILELLREHRDPMRIRKLVKLLGLPVDARKHVRRLLRSLVGEGRVVSLGRGRYRIAGKPAEVVGRLTRRGGGFLMLKPDAGRDGVKIHPDDRCGALPGDRVRVVVTRRRTRGPAEGRVTEILERGRVPVVGTYHERHRTAFVAPDDVDLGGPVLVAPGGHPGLVDGVVVAVRVDDLSPRLRGRIVDVLGEPGELATELARITLEHGLDKAFPPEVEAAVADEPEDPFRAERVDLRHVPHVTIDPPDARDFDDAVFVERRGSGYRLLVSIADVSAFVPQGGVVDLEALRRGCSVYFPSGVFPMLPRALSEELCTLAPGRDRAAVTVELDLDHDGKVTGQRMFRSHIRSAARLTYAEVQAVLEGRGEEKAGRFETQLKCAEACAKRMLERSAARGALDLDLPEPEIRLDEAGWTDSVALRDRLFSHRIIELFMIAANEAVATTLAGAGLPAIYRVHPPPDPDKLAAFARVAKALGAPVDLRGPMPSPKQVAGFVLGLRGQPVEGALSQLLLRSLMQARYSADCDGHYGLASPCYLHFTSPIRRYPDLAVHRQLTAWLAGSGTDVDEAARIADLCSQSERRALEAERAALTLHQVAYLQDRVGEVFEGSIAFVMDYGIYVRLQPSGIEGLVHVSRIGGDYYRYDEDQLALVGRRSGRSYRIGAQVRVRVEAADLVRRQIDLTFVDENPVVREERR